MYHTITRRAALKGGVALRVTVFAIGAAFMGVAGALYAHYVQNISPEVFMPMVAMFIWMSVIVGGAGNNWGLLVGAGIVMTILEGTRFLGDFIDFLDAEKLSAIRIIMIGALLDQALLAPVAGCASVRLPL